MLGYYLIFALCMVGCAVQSFLIGRKAGIQAAVDHFIDIGIIEVEPDEDD